MPLEVRLASFCSGTRDSWDNELHSLVLAELSSIVC